MNVIVHYPTQSQGKEELAKRVSEVHARAIVAKLKDLPLDNKSKLKLLVEIQEEFN